jgi:hypothetical protein
MCVACLNSISHNSGLKIEKIKSYLIEWKIVTRLSPAESTAAARSCFLWNSMILAALLVVLTYCTDCQDTLPPPGPPLFPIGLCLTHVRLDKYITHLTCLWLAYTMSANTIWSTGMVTKFKTKFRKWYYVCFCVTLSVCSLQAYPVVSRKGN